MYKQTNWYAIQMVQITYLYPKTNVDLKKFFESNQKKKQEALIK